MKEENGDLEDRSGVIVEETKSREDVFIKVEDVPEPHMCFMFGLQQALMCIGSTLSIPFILANLICAKDRSDVTAELLSISMFMCGVATLLQTTFGVRLGIVQGGSHTFIPPIVAMMSLSRWKCPEQSGSNTGNATEEFLDESWKERLREIQGNMMLASLTQVILGCTGLMGFFLKFIGPLTIAPTISLIGLSLTGVATIFNEAHWGISILTLALVVIFSQFIFWIQIPLPAFSLKQKCHVTKYPIFQLLPVMLSICISWLLCFILTQTDVLPTNSTEKAYKARTDYRHGVVDTAPWFYFPYPFKFGVPTVSAGGFVGMLAATLSSIIESVGDYFACAKISKGTPPPPHAVNRGIAMEGFSSIISGLVGAGNATTSYSGNIGAIGITKVASRRVFQYTGFILLVCGILGKFGAVLTLIPDPIIGGILTIVFGFVAAAGISTLQYIDMSSTRNLCILAVSLIVGLMVPQWLEKNPGAINTGSADLDQVLSVLLSTAMFVGGVLGLILDNTIPGTEDERGIKRWREHLVTTDKSSISEVSYELPFVTTYIRKLVCCSYFPISPTFNKEINCSCRRKSTDKIEGVDNSGFNNGIEKIEVKQTTIQVNGVTQTKL